MANLYDAIETTLQRAESEIHATEAHGVLCGFLCVSADSKSTAWLSQVLPPIETGDVLAQQTQKVLIKLQDYYRDQLNSSDFQFVLLLPSDEVALEQRLNGLKQWCDGFILGTTSGGLNQKRTEALPKDSQEFIQDILKFSQLDAQLPDDEENEKAYMQLVEYLKVGVVTLYEDAHPLPAAPSLTVQ